MLEKVFAEAPLKSEHHMHGKLSSESAYNTFKNCHDPLIEIIEKNSMEIKINGSVSYTDKDRLIQILSPQTSKILTT